MAENPDAPRTRAELIAHARSVLADVRSEERERELDAAFARIHASVAELERIEAEMRMAFGLPAREARQPRRHRTKV